MVVVDDMDAVTIAATTGPGMADDQGAAEKRLDAIIVKVDTQTLPDQLRWGAVEDALDQEPPVLVTGTTISVKSVVRRCGKGFRWALSA